MKISIEERKLHVSEEKYDTRDENLSTVLANSSDHSRARHHNLECKPVSNTLTVCVIFCPSEANTWRLKTYLEIKMSQNNTLTLGKLQRCQSQRSDLQITAGILQAYDLLKFATALSNGSTLLISSL